MKLKCWIVSIKLASTSHNEALPMYVMAHLSECKHCATEAKAYSRLGDILENERGIDSQAPEWQELLPRLTQQHELRKSPRALLLPVGTLALTAIILGIIYQMWPQATPKLVSVSKPAHIARHITKKTTYVAQKPINIIRINRPKVSNPKPNTIQYSKKTLRIRRRYKPSELTAEAPKPEHIEQPKPEPKEIAVIDVPTSDQSNNDHSEYVIQVVASDEGTYTRL